MANICGFLVVRKPDQNFDKVSVSPYFLPGLPPCIKGVCYSGISRVPWYELEENYYAGTLPQELIEFREELNEVNQPDLDLKLIKDFDKARKVLEYSNTVQDRYEIAVLYSEKLSKIKGSLEVDVDMDIDWLGIDIYYSGYGSQLKEGIFNKAILFNDFIEKINSHGLFENDKSLIEAYTDRYNEVSADNNLELMHDIDFVLRDLIRVGRVKRGQ